MARLGVEAQLASVALVPALNRGEVPRSTVLAARLPRLILIRARGARIATAGRGRGKASHRALLAQESGARVGELAGGTVRACRPDRPDLRHVPGSRPAQTRYRPRRGVSEPRLTPARRIRHGFDARRRASSPGSSARTRCGRRVWAKVPEENGHFCLARSETRNFPGSPTPTR